MAVFVGSMSVRSVSFFLLGDCQSDFPSIGCVHIDLLFSTAISPSLRVWRAIWIFISNLVFGSLPTTTAVGLGTTINAVQLEITTTAVWLGKIINAVQLEITITAVPAVRLVIHIDTLVLDTASVYADWHCEQQN